MKLRLLPKEEKFFELFKQDAENLKKGVEALKDLVDHYDNVEEKYLKIKAIEHQGDIITHDIIVKLRETFITPLEREDIHELASGMDDVLDCLEGVASRLHYFRIIQPTPEIRKLVSIINAAVGQIYEAILHLGKLGRVHSFCQEINSLEYQADLIGQEAIANLFEKTQKVEGLKDLIKFKEIYGRLESAADRCEDVANVIEGIMVKST
jgi:predicted phosphate transport protein (TIGR00153 family)